MWRSPPTRATSARSSPTVVSGRIVTTPETAPASRTASDTVSVDSDIATACGTPMRQGAVSSSRTHCQESARVGFGSSRQLRHQSDRSESASHWGAGAACTPASAPAAIDHSSFHAILLRSPQPWCHRSHDPAPAHRPQAPMQRSVLRLVNPLSLRTPLCVPAGPRGRPGSGRRIACACAGDVGSLQEDPHREAQYSKGLARAARLINYKARGQPGAAAGTMRSAVWGGGGDSGGATAGVCPQAPAGRGRGGLRPHSCCQCVPACRSAPSGS